MDRAESSKEAYDGLGFYYRRRRVGAVKSKLGRGGECDRIIVKKKTNDITKQESHCNCNDDVVRKEKLELLSLFRERCKAISRDDKDIKRADCRAKKELENEGKINKVLCARIGDVPGVRVGDKFEYRVELIMVGLHSRFEHGIDHMKLGDKNVATCIVALESHLDRMYDANVLIYVGEGGKSRDNQTEINRDQKLRGGNLALLNSMEEKIKVRVVKGFKKDVYDRYRNQMVTRTRYVYDGLYEVKHYDVKKGGLGKLIYEFRLFRCPGQPNVLLH